MASQHPFSIAIVGGGIVGLFAALCIQHHSSKSPSRRQLRIQVYEQAAEYKEIGAGIGIGPNAVRLFAELGLFDRLNALSSNTNARGPDFRRFDTGEKLFDWPKMRAGLVRARTIACARSELLDLLRGAVEERNAAKLYTGMACSRLEESGQSVTIHFENGSIATADLVVACDGIHSTIRSQFVASQPTYSGQIAYRDVIPLSSLRDWPYSISNMWLAKGSHLFAYPISRNKSLNIVAFIDKDETEIGDVKESWTAICDRSEVQKDFAGHEEAVQKIIRNMREKPSKWRINDHEPLDKWYYMDGKVILLGDACHAMLPHLGAGAAQGMEDGWILGRAISDYLRSQNSPFSTIEAMAATFQAARLPRAQKAQAMSRLIGKTYDCQTEDMVDLGFDECCPIVGERIVQAIKWVWQEEVDLAYEKARDMSSNNRVDRKMASL